MATHSTISLSHLSTQILRIQKKSQTTYRSTRILTRLLGRTCRMGYSLVPEIKAACPVARTLVVNE